MLMVSGCTLFTERARYDKKQAIASSVKIDSQDCETFGDLSLSTDISKIRYGCFCGLEYPGYSTIAEHLKLKPKDSIDDACRSHDICWLENGNGHSGCNATFLARIATYGSQFSERKDRQCAKVAARILSAFSSLGVPETSLVQQAWKALFFVPITGLTILHDPFSDLPSPDHKCMAEIK